MAAAPGTGWQLPLQGRAGCPAGNVRLAPASVGRAVRETLGWQHHNEGHYVVLEQYKTSPFPCMQFGVTPPSFIS